MWKLVVLLTSASVLVDFSQVGAKNCGTNPSTILLKRGEKITIEYWNPPSELELAQHDEPATDDDDNDNENKEKETPPAEKDEPPASALDDAEPIESPVADDVTTDHLQQVSDRQSAPGDDAVVLTVHEQAVEFEHQQIATTTLAPPSADAVMEDDAGSGSEHQMLSDEPANKNEDDELRMMTNKKTVLEASGDELEVDSTTEEMSPPEREVLILTNFNDDSTDEMMNDDTIESAIESESLHPVKAPAKTRQPAAAALVNNNNSKENDENNKETGVLRSSATTEAVPVDEATTPAVETLTSQVEGSGDDSVMTMMADEPALFKNNAEEGSGNGDFMIADEPAVFKNAEEGSGDVLLMADEPIVSKVDAYEGSGMLDVPEMHTFDETFTMKSVAELVAPPAVLEDKVPDESQTEQTTDSSSNNNVMLVDDSPAESRGDDILISRIRTIVSSLSSARPLIRRTTGLFSSVFNRRPKREVSSNSGRTSKQFYASQEFKQFMRSQPLPVRRALSPNFAGRFSRKMDRTNSLVEDECDLHIKTDPGLHLLMTFHNLSAPYTVDCVGAYVEIEREGNGFEARWCGNPIGQQQRGMRSHVIFARSEVRVSVFNSPEVLMREQMAADETKSTRHLTNLPPTGFTADIEVIDLHDAGQFTAFQRSQAYSNVKRMG